MTGQEGIDSRINIISELSNRNMGHVLKLIIGQLDFQSILRMQYVCKEWLQLLKWINPWKVILEKKMRRNPKFKASMDFFKWSQLIRSPDSENYYERVKALAYVGFHCWFAGRIIPMDLLDRIDNIDTKKMLEDFGK